MQNQLTKILALARKSWPGRSNSEALEELLKVYRAETGKTGRAVHPGPLLEWARSRG